MAYFAVQCDSRDNLKEYLEAHGVGTNIHYPIAMHRQKAFAKYGFEPHAYPIAEKLAGTVLSIPMYSGMTEEEVTYVIDTINAYKG